MKKVLIACPQCDGQDVGENLCGFEWTSRLAREADVTLLTLRFPGHEAPSKQLKGVRVVEWGAKPYLASRPRVNSTVKPWYPHFYYQARRWTKAALQGGEQFDLLHQIMPMATRYPSPFSGLEVPFILGPVGGGVATPDGFRGELGSEPPFMRLREFDRMRLRRDPMLRKTYQRAAAVIGCSPYVEEHLKDIKLKRFVSEYEVGIEELPPAATRDGGPSGPLRLLFVGRIIRTKGLRDAIRALAKLNDVDDVRLEVAGSGEDVEPCRTEAAALGVGDRVRFLGRLPRGELQPLYAKADVFLFPSFREPTGGVLFEAMQFGVPVVTSTLGGPGHIVTEACGIRVAPNSPEQFAEDIAAAIRHLALNPDLRSKMAAASRERIAELGLWERKLGRILALYDDVAGDAGEDEGFAA